jgi:hypothetical protein
MNGVMNAEGSSAMIRTVRNSERTASNLRKTSAGSMLRE